MSAQSICLLPSTMRRYADCCAMRVNGVSMMPLLHDGDVVLVDPFATEPETGDVVVALFKEPLGFKGGLVVGEWRKPRGKMWWLYKHNPNDSTYPRLSLGSIPTLRAICGTVRAIVERQGSEGDALPTLMCRPVGRPVTYAATTDGDEIMRREAAAAERFRATVSRVHEAWKRGGYSSLQLVVSPQSASSTRRQSATAWGL